VSVSVGKTRNLERVRVRHIKIGMSVVRNVKFGMSVSVYVVRYVNLKADTDATRISEY